MEDQKLFIRVQFHESGIILPDAKIRGWVTDWKLALPSEGEINIAVGNALIIQEIRVRVKNGEIDPKTIRFSHGSDLNAPDTDIYIDKDGMLDWWPKGFCDLAEEQLIQLLGWDCKKEG